MQFPIKSKLTYDIFIKAERVMRDSNYVILQINAQSGTEFYEPYEILKMVTSTNAELLSMCGKRSPYQEGKLGEISVGAYADLIIIDGNPLENINLIADPENNFKLIMKNGTVYKNTLGQ